MSVEVKRTDILWDTSRLQFFSQDIAIAYGETEEGRLIESLGTSFLSSDRAIDNAIKNLEKLEDKTEIGFKIRKISGGALNREITILKHEIRKRRNIDFFDQLRLAGVFP